MKTTRRDFLCLSAMACAWLLTGCQNPTVEERAVSWQQQEVSDPDTMSTTIMIAAIETRNNGCSATDSLIHSASLPARSSALSVNFLPMLPAPLAASFLCFCAAASANSLCISFFLDILTLFMLICSGPLFSGWTVCSVRLWIFAAYLLSIP